MSPTVARSDFDAGLVPGFREATRVAYRDLNERAATDMSATLDAGGRIVECAGCGVLLAVRIDAF